MSDFDSFRRNTISVAAISLVVAFGSVGLAAEPSPKEGLLIPKDKAAETRRWVLSLKDEPLLDGPQGIRTAADRAVAQWLATRASVEPHVPKMLDLLYESNRPEVASPEVREASKKLGEAFDDIAFLGFLYFLTAEKKYSDTAYEILDMAGRVPRWGWFNWDGSHMPQIHYGQYVRTAAFCRAERHDILEFRARVLATLNPCPSQLRRLEPWFLRETGIVALSLSLLSPAACTPATDGSRFYTAKLS